MVLAAVQQEVDRAVGNDEQVGGGQDNVHVGAPSLLWGHLLDDGHQFDHVEEALDAVTDKKDDDDEDEDGGRPEVALLAGGQTARRVASVPDTEC